MISEAVKEEVAHCLEKHTKKKPEVRGISSVSGGSINSAFRLESDQGDFFVKVNDAHRFPGMFKTETRGLQLLREAAALYVPEVIGHGIAGDRQFIVMEHIESGRPVGDFDRKFGKSLAQLHRQSADKFGLEYDNYMGSLQQFNDRHDNWAEFFIQQRLEPQLKMARDSGKMNSDHSQKFERMYQRLEEIFPNEAPALVHGDLWSGNYMNGPDGTACIYDPAAYYGHREVDIAMSRLFGGFGSGFYEGYHQAWPMEKGWEGRLDYYNLYPLLVHVNLFGVSYLRQVEGVIGKF